ncbi:MAG: FtsK/SpoIIIE domain-containing protein [Planctomycetota bacterium]
MPADRHPLDHQPALLRELFELAAWRDLSESSIKSTYEDERRNAEQSAERELRQLDSSATQRRESMEFERDQKLASLTTSIDDEESSIRTRLDAERERLIEKADRNETEARKALQEAVWATETVFEAKEHLPGEAFEQSTKLVEGNQRALDQTQENATALLRRYRLKSLLPLLDQSAPENASADYAEFTSRAQELVQVLRTRRLPRSFIGIRLPLLIVVPVIIAVVTVGLTRGWSWTAMEFGIVGGVAVVTAALLFGLYRAGRTKTTQTVDAIGSALAHSRAASDKAMVVAEHRRRNEERELRERRDHDIAAAHEKYEPIIAKIDERRSHHLERIDSERTTEVTRLSEERTERTRETASHYEHELKALDEEHTASREAMLQQQMQAMADVNQRYTDAWNSFESSYRPRLTALEDAIDRVTSSAQIIAPSWTQAAFASWSPPQSPSPMIPIGTFRIDRTALPGGVTDDDRVRSRLPNELALPAALEVPDRCSLLLQAGAEGREIAVQALQNTALRLLTSLPPGKVRFTVLDPVGLGQSFAGLMHLADYEEAQIIDKIWTETRHIEQRLVDLTEHMENVIQKYLRNEFDTIDAYNEAANEIAEPYRFLIVSDFPTNFSDAAMQRLASIASSGARCGVYTLVFHDTRANLPTGFDIGDLERSSICLKFEDGRYVWNEAHARDLTLRLESPADDAFATTLLHSLGRESIDASRVEVPFQTICPDETEIWTGSTASEIRVPLGRAGATKLQTMALGRGTSQHVLIAGKTGSGKSTLLHAMITNLALMYSPAEVQFYLIDFKKGVEFKPYAALDLPHARAVAIESDREFGLSVLDKIDEELKRRGNRFRDEQVQDLAGYRAVQPDDAMPRILLIIDEFQELFVDDDKLAQDASLLLDRLVRQGRAFGIHVILGSQTLGGAYSLARSTIGQMAVRIALQCSESDAYMIMSDDNAAARLLSRPGEAIYNDASGLVEGNSPFQVAWLPDEERETILQSIQERAAAQPMAGRIPMMVFEGNIPAEVRRNHLLESRLAAPSDLVAPTHVSAWLGDAIAIKDPTSADLERHSGANVLIVGQRDDAALAMMSVSMISMAAQLGSGRNGTGGARFVVLDGSSPDAFAAQYWPRVASSVPHDVAMVPYRDVADVLGEIAREIDVRQEDNAIDRPAIILMIYGLQRYRVLRPTDDFTFSVDADAPPAPDKLLASILRDGPTFGVHTFAWCDTMSNLSRSLGRPEMREFERRVLFQMSATDSANLIDSPAAGKLGLQRALFFSEERGSLEKFRPYAVPDDAWLREVSDQLATEASTG